MTHEPKRLDRARFAYLHLLYYPVCDDRITRRAGVVAMKTEWRDHYIQFRTTDREAKMLAKLCKRYGLSLSETIRYTLRFQDTLERMLDTGMINKEVEWADFRKRQEMGEE